MENKMLLFFCLANLLICGSCLDDYYEAPDDTAFISEKKLLISIIVPWALAIIFIIGDLILLCIKKRGANSNNFQSIPGQSMSSPQNVKNGQWNQEIQMGTPVYPN